MPLPWGRLQGIRNLQPQVDHATRLEPLGSEPILKGLTLESFHDQEGLSLVLRQVVDGADVRMVQGRGSTGLALKPLQRVGPAGEILWEKLQRHFATEVQILGFVHHPHPASTQPTGDLEVRDRLANHEVKGILRHQK